MLWYEGQTEGDKGKSRETKKEAAVIIKAKDDGNLDHGGGSGGSWKG